MMSKTIFPYQQATKKKLLQLEYGEADVRNENSYAVKPLEFLANPLHRPYISLYYQLEIVH
jgi:hypothetical protein